MSLRLSSGIICVRAGRQRQCPVERMGRMLSSLRAWWGRYQLQRSLERLSAWYSLTYQIWDLCGQALRNERVGQKGAGFVLDQIDRTIFRLNDQPPPVTATLRRRFPELAKTVSTATENVFHLRNHTALFLIHCQGPTPAESTPSDAECRYFYERAMDKHGLKALELWRELEQQFAAIREGMHQLEVG